MKKSKLDFKKEDSMDEEDFNNFDAFLKKS